MSPKNKHRPPALPPLPCPLTYDTDGRWTPSTIAAARQCVLNNLDRDLSWWRSKKAKGCGARVPDIDGTLCRLRMQGPRSVLTNMMLVRSSNGRLSAKVLLDPGDDRGPMRHWPAVRHGPLEPMPRFAPPRRRRSPFALAADGGRAAAALGAAAAH